MVNPNDSPDTVIPRPDYVNWHPSSMQQLRNLAVHRAERMIDCQVIDGHTRLIRVRPGKYQRDN